MDTNDYTLWSFMKLENMTLQNTKIPRTLIFCCNARACKNICMKYKSNEKKKAFCKKTWELCGTCDNYQTFKDILSTLRFLCYNDSFNIDMLNFSVIQTEPLRLAQNFENEIRRIHQIQSNIIQTINSLPKLENCLQNKPPPLKELTNISIAPFQS